MVAYPSFLFVPGELANVHLASHKSTKKTFALKIFDKLHCLEHTAGFDAIKSLNREAEVLKMISSPFILQMHQAWQDKSNVYFLLPLIQGGELSKRLYDYTNEQGDSEVGLPTDHVLFYTACIAEALSHMHKRNIAYRDLKPGKLPACHSSCPLSSRLLIGKFCALVSHINHLIEKDNVMIDKEGYCVLIDLGFTKVVEDKTYTMCGTPG